MYPDGRIGISDFLPMAASEIGNLRSSDSIDEMLSRFQTSPAANQMRDLLAQCDTCSVSDVCRGGELSHRLSFRGTSYSSEYCDSRIKMVQFGRELTS